MAKYSRTGKGGVRPLSLASVVQKSKEIGVIDYVWAH